MFLICIPSLHIFFQNGKNFGLNQNNNSGFREIRHSLPRKFVRQISTNSGTTEFCQKVGTSQRV